MNSEAASKTRPVPALPAMRRRIRWTRTSSPRWHTAFRRRVGWGWASTGWSRSSPPSRRSATSSSSPICVPAMLSLSFIREHPDLVKEGARKKGEPAPVDEILRLDAERREMVTKLEQLKAEQNRRSAAMAKSRDEAAVEELRRMRVAAKALGKDVGPVDTRLNALLLEVPNPPDDP